MTRRVTRPGLSATQVQALIDAGGFATAEEVEDAVAALVNSSPDALDTLNELAAALDNDPNFAETVLDLIGGKAAADHNHDGTYATAGHNHDGTYATAGHNHDSSYAAKSSAFVVVSHGATAGTSRPTGIGAVYWIGSVQPTNAVNGDQWYDTTGDS